MAEAAVAELAAREKRTVRALLRSEKRAADRLTKTIHVTSTEVAATIAAGAHGPATVRRQLPPLQAALLDDLRVSQREARRSGRDSLSAALGEHALDVDRLLEVDEASAAVASAGLTASWGAAALATIAAGRSVAGASAKVKPSIQRVAAYETAKSFNEERDELLGVLVRLRAESGSGTPPRDEDAPGPGMFKVFSAVLDGVTCPRCFEADGQVVELRKAFRSGPPPLHPHCRCVVEHIIVAKPERLEDVAIDYDLLKQEIRDVIREGRKLSQREALRFVAESLGEKRSPITLTRRFASESYATRRSP